MARRRFSGFQIELGFAFFRPMTADAKRLHQWQHVALKVWRSGSIRGRPQESLAMR